MKRYGRIVSRKMFAPEGDLLNIPGVGKSIAEDLRNIGIQKVADLKGKDPEKLYEMSNRYEGIIQDRCLLYVFREAVYFAENKKPDPELLKWWNWKDKKLKTKIIVSIKKRRQAIICRTPN